MKYTIKITAATIARAAALLLALANQILSAFGKSPLPIESSTVEQLVTTGITLSPPSSTGGTTTASLRRRWRPIRPTTA